MTPGYFTTRSDAVALLERFDRAELGRRLRAARVAANLTQGKAAAGVGMGRTTLLTVERGERRVRPDELASLARLYSTSVNRLVSPTAISIEVKGQFRATGSGASARNDALRLLLDLATGYVELERTIDRPLHAAVHLAPYPSGGSRAHAEDAATYVRGVLGLGMAPIEDLFSLAELQLGLRLFVRALNSRVSGAYIFHPEVGGCVLVNAGHPHQRRVWSLAHEIGHFVGHREGADALVLGEEAQDQFADAFAGAFLMPPASLRRRFQELAARGSKFTPRDLILLAHEFHVSLEAACRWLERLKLLPSQTYEALRERGLDSKTVRAVVGAPEPDSTAPIPARLLMIAAEAYQRGTVSEGRLVDLLGLDRLAVRELLDGVPDGAFSSIE